jgi:acyl-CoA synthetase (AMP-forming)/AMP-acid ligase II
VIRVGSAVRDSLLRLDSRAALYNLHGAHLSGSGLVNAVDRLAGHLVASGLQGQKIGLLYRNSFAAVQAFLAVEWVGGARVTVDPRAPVTEAAAIFAASGVAAVLLPGRSEDCTLVGLT